MTVKELKEWLDEFNDEADVYIEPVINATPCESVEYDKNENIVYLN